MARSGRPATPRFKVGPFAPEPSAESFVSATTQVPFSADWQVTPRVRHLVAVTSPFGDWTAAERETVVVWLKDEIHVDLGLFPEYAGSVHLIAPNPVFRGLFVRHEQDEQGRSALVVAITPRAGHTIDGLDLIVEEKRATGIGLLACVSLKEPSVRVELPHFPAEIRERVVDPRRGLLLEGHFRMFGVGFTLTTSLASQIRRVEPGKPADAYEVALVGEMANVSRVGPESPTRTAPSILHAGAGARRRNERGEGRQRWFRDRAPDATRALRELVGPAEGSLLVCDPYFGGEDLLRVILAIANPDTEVQILTSAMHLRSRGGVAADLLERRLEEVQRAPPVNPIEVRVMPGKKPAIHDRFIITEQTWMLGGSINNFGERGTLMVIVPDSRPVEEDLRRVWKESRVFADWLVTRRAAVTP